MESNNTDLDSVFETPARMPALSRAVVAAIACAAGVSIGFMAGAWSSQAAIEEQCRATGAAAVGEVVIGCSTITTRSTGYR
ncbi:MAG TPA: hypothetical protein VIN03_17690 [Roseateles sp.]